MNILFFVILSITVILFLIFAIALIRNGNEVKCPNCGKTMEFAGNMVGHRDYLFGEVDSRERKLFGYYHLYKCPKCGTTKVI